MTKISKYDDQKTIRFFFRLQQFFRLRRHYKETDYLVWETKWEKLRNYKENRKI